MSHNWNETHYASVMCRMRQWRREKDAQGWKRTKLSNREVLEALGISCEISPFDPKHGLVLYVNATVHRVLSESDVRVFTLGGPIRMKRPFWMIERWLREYASSQL